jgi:tetratricopeptide (TPR) repeat protein
MTTRTTMKRPPLYSLALSIALLAAAGPVTAGAHGPTGAQRDAECSEFLTENLGDHHMAITTDSAEAQRLFDQGLTLSYAFNHDEAERSFRMALEADPQCAMCYWGIALVQGPNINAAMDPEDTASAYAASQSAQRLAAGTAAREQALIQALTARYAQTQLADRSELDQAYAAAMQRVAARFPSDSDVLALTAEALMDTRPWSYWGPGGEGTDFSQKLLTLLQETLAVDETHPGANHLYIHAVEAQHPQLGFDAAERLAYLVPGAGHMVHMPAHIYLRTGRYHDATLANQQAVAADRSYLEACEPGGFYAMMYVRHNYDFLVGSAALEGRFVLAQEVAEELADSVREQARHMPEMLELQQWLATPWQNLVRFGKWQEMLAIEAPEDDLRYANALWHYAQAHALMGTGELAAAKEQIEAFAAIATDPSLTGRLMGTNNARDILAVGLHEVSGALAAERGDYAEAIAHLEQAVAGQDALNYMEPPPWYRPTRLNLGAVLLEAGQPEEAETVFRENLERFPENGWGLFGLYESLTRQGRDAEAAEVWTRCEQAWRNADIPLTTAAF